MKFVITMKNPDSFEDSIRQAAEDSVDELVEDREEKVESQYNDLKEFASKWVEYDEYIRVEFDQEEGTATVLEY